MHDPDIGFIVSFLDAAGYRTQIDGVGVINSEKSIEGGVRRLRVWAPFAVPSPVASSVVLADCAARTAAKAKQEVIVVLPQPLAFGSSFQTAAKAAGAEVRTYAQFLDDPFQQEGGSIGIEAGPRQGRGGAAAEYLLQLRKPWLLGTSHPELLSSGVGAKTDWTKGRVPQPYRWIAGRPPQPPSEAPADALDHLLASLYDATDRPRVDLVVGNAGVGKSDLFDAVFTFLYSHFQNEKRGHRWSVRPSAVVPARILKTAGISSGELFEAIAETEAVGAVSPRLFDWYMASGNMVLMFDGLDEFFADQTDFLATLEQRFLRPGSRARVLIVLRDSLLLNPQIQTLLERIKSNPSVNYSLVEVTKWGEPGSQPVSAYDQATAVRSFAWIRYEGRLPAGDEPDPPKVSRFVAVAAAPSTATLFSLPFYCQCLFEWLEERPEPPADKFALLEFVLSRLIRREWDKVREGREEAAGGAPVEAAFATRTDLFDRLVFNAFVRFKTSLPMRILDTAFGTAPASVEDDRSADAYLKGRRRLDGEVGLSRLLEDTAFAVRRKLPGGETEETRLNLAALADLYRRERPIDLTRQQRADGERVFQKIALFEQGDGDSLAFTHDILADYLAGRAAVRRLKGEHRSTPEIAIGQPRGAATEIYDEVLGLALAAEPRLAEHFRAAADESENFGFKQLAYGILLVHEQLGGRRQPADARASVA